MLALNAVSAVGRYLERRGDFSGQKGRGFSIEGRGRLGLATTVYLGEGRYKTHSLRFRQNLMLLGAAEAQALMQ